MLGIRIWQLDSFSGGRLVASNSSWRADCLGASSGWGWPGLRTQSGVDDLWALWQPGLWVPWSRDWASHSSPSLHPWEHPKTLAHGFTDGLTLGSVTLRTRFNLTVAPENTVATVDWAPTSCKDASCSLCVRRALPSQNTSVRRCCHESSVTGEETEAQRALS